MSENHSSWRVYSYMDSQRDYTSLGFTVYNGLVRDTPVLEVTDSSEITPVLEGYSNNAIRATTVQEGSVIMDSQRYTSPGGYSI
ncbi:unnamed protein product [Coregonus sp. 'balchen']|nr:unnamed protein product [Coregonus sp. 'balchen']